jgi:uracil-DNA glycosylase
VLKGSPVIASATSSPLPLVQPCERPEAHTWATSAADLERLHHEMRACRQCVAAGYLGRADSVAGFRGRLGDRVMIVGQAPGHLSVERGLPFSGPGGKILSGWLVRAGFAPEDFRARVYITSLTKCDPGPNPRGGGDRKPSPAELALCRPFLLRELALVRPPIILPVGGMAISAFVGPGRLDDLIGSGVERDGVRILPLPHPSGVSRWLNAPAHQELLARALALLSNWREELGTDPATFY